jgi:hypothetical protein
VLAIIGTIAFQTLMPSQSMSAKKPALALRVERQGEDWRISWDRTAPILKGKGVQGKLTIFENGTVMREVALQHEELLLTGSIVYAPLNQHVQFRLEITGPANKSVETVLAIKGPTTPIEERNP